MNKHLINKSKLEKLIEEETINILSEMKVSFNNLDEAEKAPGTTPTIMYDSLTAEQKKVYDEAYAEARKDTNLNIEQAQKKADSAVYALSRQKLGVADPVATTSVGKFAGQVADPSAKSLYAKEPTPVPVAPTEPEEEIEDSELVQAIQELLAGNERYQDILMYLYPGEDDGIDNKYGWRTKCAVSTFYRDVGEKRSPNHNNKREVYNFIKKNISKATNTALLSNVEKNKCRPIEKPKSPTTATTGVVSKASAASGAATSAAGAKALRYDKDRKKNLNDFMTETQYTPKDIYFLIHGKYSNTVDALKNKTDINDFYDYLENWESIKDRKLYYIGTPSGNAYFNNINSLFSFLKFLETNKMYPDGKNFVGNIDDVKVFSGNRKINETKPFKDYDFYDQWELYASAGSKVTQWLADNEMTMEELQTSLTNKDYIKDPSMEFDPRILTQVGILAPAKLVRIIDDANIPELKLYANKTLSIFFVKDLLEKIAKAKKTDQLDFIELRFETGFKNQTIKTDLELSDIPEFGNVLSTVDSALQKDVSIDALDKNAIKKIKQEIKENIKAIKEFMGLPKITLKEADEVAQKAYKYFMVDNNVQTNDDVKDIDNMVASYTGKIVVDEKGSIWHAKEYILTGKRFDTSGKPDTNGELLLPELKNEGYREYNNYFENINSAIHNILKDNSYNLTQEDIVKLTTDKVDQLYRTGKFGMTKQGIAYGKEIWNNVKDTAIGIYKDIKSAPLEAALLAYMARGFFGGGSVRENRNRISKKDLERIILEETYKVLKEQEQAEFNFMKDVPEQKKTDSSTKVVASNVLSNLKNRVKGFGEVLGGPVKSQATFMLIIHLIDIITDQFNSDEEKINSLDPQMQEKYKKFKEQMTAKIAFEIGVKTFTENLTTEQASKEAQKRVEELSTSFLNKTIPSRRLGPLTAAGVTGAGFGAAEALGHYLVSLWPRAAVAAEIATAGEAAVAGGGIFSAGFLIPAAVLGIAFKFGPYLERKLSEKINIGAFDGSLEIDLSDQERYIIELMNKILSEPMLIKTEEGTTDFSEEIQKLIFKRYSEYKTKNKKLLPLENLILSLNSVLDDYNVNDAQNKENAKAIMDMARGKISKIEQQLRDLKDRMTPRGLGPLMRIRRPDSMFENKKNIITKKYLESIIEQETMKVLLTLKG